MWSKRWKSKYSRKEIMPGSCPIQFCSSSEVPLFSSISPGALILLHTVQSSTWLLHNTLYQRTLGLSPSPSSCYGHYGDSVSLSGRQVWDIPQDRCIGITPVFLSVWRTSVMLYPDQKQLKSNWSFSVYSVLMLAQWNAQVGCPCVMAVSLTSWPNTRDPCPSSGFNHCQSECCLAAAHDCIAAAGKISRVL